MTKLLAPLALCFFASVCWGAPPDATAYQITVNHAGATTSGGVLALQLTPRWSVTLPAPSAYPLIVGTKVYAVANGLLYALDIQTGSTVWGPNQVPSAIGATYDGGKIFVVASGGLLSAFDAVTGTPGWSVQLPGQYAFSSPPTASNGTVYVGGAGSGGTLYAVNEVSGALFWTASVANGDNSSPTVGPAAVYVSYACLNTYSFNLTTGVQNWLNPTVCEGGGGETTVYANGKLYARDDVSGNDIFDAATGTILGSFASSTPPAVDATTAFYLNAGTLSAVDLASTAVRWSFAGDSGLTSAPLIVDHTVIVGSSSGNVYGVDEQSGRVTWQVNVAQAVPTGVEWFDPANGFAIADGVLVIPAGSDLIAYSIFGPPAPTNLTASAGVGAVQVAWTAASGAASYNVYVATSPGAEPLTPTLTGVSGTGALVTNLAPGTRYYFTVKTIGSAGISAASTEVSAIPVAPAPAANLTAVAARAAAQLTWTASSNATSYNIYMGTAAGGESSTPAMTSVSTSATVTGLTPGTSYYFTVKAVTNGATSAASNEAVAIPLVPAPPTAFAAAAAIGGATFSWVASSGATSYQIYVGTAAGAESANPSQSGLVGTTATISNLNAGTTYYAVIRAVAGGVASGPSNEVSFITQSYSAPQNVVLTPGIGEITVSWSASPGATGYSVYVGTAAGQESATPAQSVSGLQAVFTGLTNTSTYYFYVQATTAIGASLPSAEVSSTPELPPGPTNLGASGGAGEVTLTWSASSGATSYNIYQGTTAGGESTTPVQTGITGLSSAIQGLGAGTQYYYIVRAVTPAGISAASNEASAMTTAAAASGHSGGGGMIDGWIVMALGLLAMTRLRLKE